MCFQELLKCLWICKLLCKPGLTVCDFTSNIVFPSKPRTEFEYWAICFCRFKLNFQNTKCLVSRENENEENEQSEYTTLNYYLGFFPSMKKFNSSIY